MKKTILLCSTLMLLCLASTAQTTYYYKLTKKNVNGVINENVSGGQFITISKDVCYESDKDGFSVNHGRMDYIDNEANGLRLYVGSSYYGDHTSLLFKSDFSSFHIKTDNGDIYYYTRATPPAGVTTCSLIRQVRKEEPRKQTPTPVYIPQDNPYQPWTLPPNPTPKDQPQPNPTPSPDQKCPICQGSKICTYGPGMVAYSTQYCLGDKKCHECSGTGVKNGHRCTYCDGSGKCGSCGGTGKCRTCGGTGKIR